MVTRVVEIDGAFLYSLIIKSFLNGRATRVSLFAYIAAAPYVAFVACYDRVVFFDNADATSYSVVAKLASVSPVVNRHESVRPVPFVCSAPIVYNASVEVIGKS